MKRIAAAFTALFVLASCLMAGGSIYMHAHRNDLEITGEVLYGERAMASGIEVRQSVLIDGHPNWEVSYSPAAASHVTQGGLVPARAAPHRRTASCHQHRFHHVRPDHQL